MSNNSNLNKASKNKNDEFILTENDMQNLTNTKSSNISDDEIDDLCEMLLENDKLIHEFSLTNKWLNIPTKIND